jgi:hypothetical protein
MHSSFLAEAMRVFASGFLHVFLLLRDHAQKPSNSIPKPLGHAELTHDMRSEILFSK